MKNIDTLLASLQGCTYFSSLDCNKGYLQIPLSPQAARYCGVILEDNLYQVNFLPFGVSVGTSIFSRVMAEILHGLEDIAASYLDDIVIFSRSPNFVDHLNALERVFQRLLEYDLRLNPKKCKLFKKQTTFLGHKVDFAGYTPSDNSVDAVRNFRRPTDIRGVRQFQGLANFFRKHIPNFSTIMEPITRLTRKSAKFHWGPDQEKSFTLMRELLTSEPVLAFPDYSLPFEIFCDSSSVGIGGALVQKVPNTKNEYRVISYFSKTLTDAERKAPPVQSELFSIVYCLRKSKPHIYMSDTIVHTDHRPLVYLQSKADMHPHLARWLIELQSYPKLKISYVSGSLNSLADALSRVADNQPPAPPSEEIQDIVEFPICMALDETPSALLHDHNCLLLLRDADYAPYTLDLRTEQKKDPELLPFFQTNNLSQQSATGPLSASYIIDNDGCLRYSSPTNSYQFRSETLPIIIPSHLRKLVFDYFHSSILAGGHFNARKTFFKCSMRYYWPNMRSHIYEWSKACVSCQQRNSPNPPRIQPMAVIPKNRIMAQVALDACGPFRSTSRSNCHILNFVCCFSRYVVSVAVPDVRAPTLARALLNHVYLVYGGIVELISDGASAFTSEFFREFCNLLNIHQVYSIPYFSQSNGLIERTFRTYLSILAKYMQESGSEFDELLSAASFAYNTSVHSATNESPWYLVFGRIVHFSIDTILDPSARRISYDTSEIGLYRAQLIRSLRAAWNAAAEESFKAQRNAKTSYDKRVFTDKLAVGDRVWLFRKQPKKYTSPKFHSPWAGQYRILEIRPPTAIIQSCLCPTADPKTVHLNQLKKVFELTGPALTYPRPQDSDKDPPLLAENVSRQIVTTMPQASTLSNTAPSSSSYKSHLRPRHLIRAPVRYADQT